MILRVEFVDEADNLVAAISAKRLRNAGKSISVVTGKGRLNPGAGDLIKANRKNGNRNQHQHAEEKTCWTSAMKFGPEPHSRTANPDDEPKNKNDDKHKRVSVA